MELALGPGELRDFRCNGKVSILVFVELALGRRCYNSSPRLVVVSILVFVELALGPEFVPALHIEPRSFNPCFRGTCPRTGLEGPPPAAQRRVSILVFVELALGRYHSNCRLLRLFCFNPCFRGTCPRTLTQSMRKVGMNCFNPCFRGTCPRTITSIEDGFWRQVSILVFVELALGRYTPTSMQLSTFVSILVFVELALGQDRLDLLNTLSVLFQSLFSWNLPSDLSVVVIVAYRLWFQSLFSWNLPSDSKEISGEVRRSSFNPCFRGTCPRTLLLVHLVGSLHFCFNPCFRGTCPRTCSPSHFSAALSRFNPCFRGTCPRTLDQLATYLQKLG